MEGAISGIYISCLSLIGTSVAWSTEEVKCVVDEYIKEGK